MKKLNMFLMLAVLGFGMMIPQTAQAGPVTKAPCEDSRVRATGGGNCYMGPQWNARIAIAPYAQVVADDSYTFIGISHPSLATAHTSIGLVVEAMDMTTVPNTPAGRAAVFTVSAGETHRVFIVNQSHSTININNASFTDTQTHIITTSDASQFGNVKVWGVGTHPTDASLDADRPGWYTGTAANADVLRHDNVSQLSMWGVVYQASNGAGFALEFIGDMHDSTGTGGTLQEAQGHDIVGTSSSGAGRGIN